MIKILVSHKNFVVLVHDGIYKCYSYNQLLAQVVGDKLEVVKGTLTSTDAQNLRKFKEVYNAI